MAYYELSKNNPYWIPMHRYCELKHFCLQYPIWKSICNDYSYYASDTGYENTRVTNSRVANPTEDCVLKRRDFMEKIQLVESIAEETDSCLGKYLLKGVTEDCSYNYLYTVMKIPCSRGTYYNRYRKFFWLLDKYRR